MKILVLSDSHYREKYVYEIMQKNTDADVLIHLGDGEDDIMRGLRELPAFGNVKLIRVKGNCDLGSALPECSFDTLAGIKFMSTHGYREGVKQGVYMLYATAMKNERQVALFGHTHEQFYDEMNGVHLFNPGAANDLHYGIINIDETTGQLEFLHF